MHRRTLLRAGAAAAGGLMMPGAGLIPADRTPLEHAREVTAAIGRAMHTGSLSDQLGALRTHVADITDLVAAADSFSDRRAALAELAHASKLHMWAAEDALQPDEAHRAAAVTARAGQSAAEPDLHALGLIALASSKLNHYGEAAAARRCADDAQHVAGATGTLVADGACWEAAAAAAQHDTYTTLAALERAQVAAAKDEPSSWHLHRRFTPDHVANWAGVLQARTGKPRLGEETLRTLITSEVFSGTNQYFHLLTDLVEVYVAQGEVEGACLVAAEVYQGAHQRRSGFKLKRLRDVCQPLMVHVNRTDVLELRAAFDQLHA